MAVPENQGGGEGAIDAIAGGGMRSRRGASGSTGINTDVSQLEVVDRLVNRLDRSVKSLVNSFGLLKGATSGVFGGLVGGGGGGAGGGGAGTVGGSMGPSMSNSGIGTMMAAGSTGRAIGAPVQDVISSASGRIARGAQYGLSADRMSVLYQQMYGMTNAQVRGGVRMPMTENYLLGGPGAINQMMALQASTGLSATGQARSVEAFRAMSGFSISGGQAAQMIGTLATPEVANRMFMMGGGIGMYGIGGQERTGMQTIQDIIRRTGLTNPEALKGALQQGSNTRQRLTAMGVPQDMQEMVIQYAMQNVEYQKKTGSKGAMYDPSLEADRRTMGIEGSYAVQHEKTAGEMAKREERFYGRQVDNFADFERNLRTATKALAAFEDAMSGLIGVRISTAGHPVTQGISKVIGAGAGVVGAASGFGDASPPANGSSSTGNMATGAGPGGGQAQVDPASESHLAKIKPELAGPLRQMLRARPSLRIGGSVRSPQEQESSFKKRYRPRPEWSEKSKPEDRIWNGVVWEHISGYTMAAPGSSLHEQGLAVDLVQTSTEDMQWVMANASKFGLDHGGTGKGGASDEPFHIQPKGYWNKVAQDTEKVAQGTSAGSVTGITDPNSRGVTGGINTRTVSSGGPSNTVAFAANTAGATAGELGRVGLVKQVGTLMEGIDQPHQLSSEASRIAGTMQSSTGDAMGPLNYSAMGTSSVTNQNRNFSITISPNINISTTGNMNGDLQSMAREIGRLLENEVKVRMMRAE